MESPALRNVEICFKSRSYGCCC